MHLNYKLPQIIEISYESRNLVSFEYRERKKGLESQYLENYISAYTDPIMNSNKIFQKYYITT